MWNSVNIFSISVRPVCNNSWFELFPTTKMLQGCTTVCHCPPTFLSCEPFHSFQILASCTYLVSKMNPMCLDPNRRPWGFTLIEWHPILNYTNSPTACLGQTIRAANLTGIIGPANGTGCDMLSMNYGVTTGDLQAAIEDPNCVFLASTYCVPAACTLMKVPTGDS